ncbi:hypothetical protein [Bacillus atrophaeus]|uniref:Uncharacterized protein n=1 Tax=Bacillus atrophaeus (strain 1942) TaxID=720555 RepID=A0ABM5LYF9_BACA1|nr:hypothetical protein [Bacillus atrophaeus]AMR62356.1 hypothetical protein A1D11_08020 [Bacillus subtilis subsp. globigii]ADP32851.1 hypothetical protein BATR1942_09590 [Bacillus atrophaeus 1942]AIK46884.1 hypothetical protein DJ95_1802 [Bacillus atrophaeus subsp. globigii]EIM12028.1 hypothetical protein UY9_03763 [Bacillus atrophaeus C89]KAA6455022.1 hypothetical protein DX926_02980 [Bacillus atrophaeus]
MKPTLIKTEEVEKVVKTEKVVGVSDHIAKAIAVALLTGDYTVANWESEQDWYKTKETLEIEVKGVSITIKS